jgi:regulatory protein
MAKGTLDAAALDKAALDYLGHYASSSENLRRVLMRRAARAGLAGDERKDVARIAGAVVARLLANGLLDDRAYAAQLAASLHRRGASAASIRFRLGEKGVGADDAAAALAALGAGAASELAAACALARRRRIGPYRASPSRAEYRERDLGVLARAGFALDIARRVLAARDADAVEALARGDG